MTAESHRDLDVVATKVGSELHAIAAGAVALNELLHGKEDLKTSKGVATENMPPPAARIGRGFGV